MNFGNQVFLFGKRRFSGAGQVSGKLRQPFLSSERSGSRSELAFDEL
jgi:hypothetical protein